MSHEPPLTLTANYQLTEADLVAALRYRRWGDPVARRRFFLRWAGCVVASVLLAVVLWRFLGENAGVSIAIPLVAITMMWPFALWNQPKATAQQLSKLPGVLDPSWITVTPDALVVANSGAAARRDWHSVQEIVATGQHTLFILGPLSVIAAPWRCFGTPSEAQRFTELARQYWLMAKASPPSVATVDEEMTEALGPERLEVRFRLEPSDLSGYFRHHMRWRPQMLLALACLGLVFAGIGGSMAGWTGAAVGAVLGMVGCPWLIIWLSVRQARSSPGVLADQTIYFSPRGIWSLTAGIGQGRVEWSAITELEGLPNLILLKRGPNHAIVIPRRAFEDSAAADRFLAQVTRWRLPYVPAAPPSKRRRG